MSPGIYVLIFGLEVIAFWVLWALILVLLGYPIYFFLSVPFRRAERASIFIDLLEKAVANKQKPEEIIQSASRSQDRSLGARFHLLAAHLERGLNLEQALAKVPRIVPAAIAQMIRTGCELGDLRQVIPACRQLLADGKDQVRKGQSYLIVLMVVLGPAIVWVIGVVNTFVMPKFEAIFADMMDAPSVNLHQVMRYQNYWSLVSLIVGVVVWCGALIYVGGPRVTEWLDRIFPGLYEAIMMRLPWRRKRMQRDFAAMLAVLLDAGVPEEKAVIGAARCTANRAFARRAERVVADLQRGIKLTEAVRHLDDAGEFRWRLANAAQGQGKFTAALAGWQESLDARAFQQEQAATHLITSALVFWNGLIVAATTWCVFKFLSDLIWEGTTW